MADGGNGEKDKKDKMDIKDGGIGRFLRAKYIVPLLILAVGCPWAVMSMNDGLAQIERMTSVASNGTIVDIQTYTSEDDGNKEIAYRPVVKFEDSDHQSHRAKSLSTTKQEYKYSVGDSVSVLYDPRDADAGCIIKGEEKSAKSQAESRGPLGIILVVVVAVVVCIAMA